MKKFLAIIVLGLLWCNVGFAEENKPEYNLGSLNKNIIVHGWKIKSSKIFKTKDGVPYELYTLMNGKWTLKCIVTHDENVTLCRLP